MRNQLLMTTVGLILIFTILGAIAGIIIRLSDSVFTSAVEGATIAYFATYLLVMFRITPRISILSSLLGSLMGGAILGILFNIRSASNFSDLFNLVPLKASGAGLLLGLIANVLRLFWNDTPRSGAVFPTAVAVSPDRATTTWLNIEHWPSNHPLPHHHIGHA